jgi:hypothetical protein
MTEVFLTASIVANVGFVLIAAIYRDVARERQVAYDTLAGSILATTRRVREKRKQMVDEFKSIFHEDDELTEHPPTVKFPRPQLKVVPRD